MFNITIRVPKTHILCDLWIEASNSAMSPHEVQQRSSNTYFASIDIQGEHQVVCQNFGFKKREEHTIIRGVKVSYSIDSFITSLATHILLISDLRTHSPLSYIFLARS